MEEAEEVEGEDDDWNECSKKGVQDRSVRAHVVDNISTLSACLCGAPEQHREVSRDIFRRPGSRVVPQCQDGNLNLPLCPHEVQGFMSVGF